MAKNPWDDDPDVAAMRSMRPRGGATPWGRVFLGVLVVGCGTFGLAYYLPLYRAHRALADDHARLRGELENQSASLKQAQGELKSVTERRDELEAEHQKREALVKSRSGDDGTLKAALATALEKPAKKKQALVGADDAGIRVALASSLLFTTGKIDVSGQGRAALCAVAKASGSRSLRIVGVAADSDVPALLKAKFSSGWSYTAAAAASVAEALQTQCDVAAGRLAIAGSADTAAPRAFSGQSPPLPRVEIAVSPPDAAKSP